MSADKKTDEWAPVVGEVCPDCGSKNIQRGTGFPGVDDDELRCDDCDCSWSDGSDE